MKKYFLLFLSLYFFLQEVGACPGCVGANPKDKNIFIIVGIFVILIYIPMFVLYKMIYKHRNHSKSFSKA